MHLTTQAPYDLANPEVLENPFPLYRRMRREDPVHWSEAMQAWVLTRHDDVHKALRDPRLSANRLDALVNFQLRKLSADPALIKGAIEEILRFDGAVSFTHRVAVADLEIGGKAVRTGEVVYLGLAAANRDPEAFTDPEVFDITRPVARHIAFGAGPHVCIGAGLTRRELEIGLLTLFRRKPGLRLIDEDPPRRRCESLVFRGFHTLPVAC